MNKHNKFRFFTMLVLFGSCLLISLTAYSQTLPFPHRILIPPPPPTLMWINHLDFLPGDPSVITSFNAINSGVGSGLSGLIIQSTTLGDTAIGGGNKVIEKGIQVPPDFSIIGVRVCYELSNARSFITQISLNQLQDPPSVTLSRLDDGTDQTNPDPVCVDSAQTSIDPRLGAVRLSLRVNFGSTSDRIVLRAVGLRLRRIP